MARLHPTQPLFIKPAQSVAQAVSLMRQEKVGCVLVCEEDRLVGIFTERDLMRRVLAEKRGLDMPVLEFMTPNPVIVQSKQTIGAAVRLMEEGGYRHLPVMNEAGRPVGVLSVKRIVHYLVEHFPSTVYNLPPDPGIVPQEREGA
ncbi:MAG: cyclic nucleotide-binding/CBS domain-containing protein [Gemmataceae bacterium]